MPRRDAAGPNYGPISSSGRGQSSAASALASFAARLRSLAHLTAESGPKTVETSDLKQVQHGDMHPI